MYVPDELVGAALVVARMQERTLLSHMEGPDMRRARKSSAELVSRKQFT